MGLRNHARRREPLVEIYVVEAEITVIGELNPQRAAKDDRACKECGRAVFRPWQRHRPRIKEHGARFLEHARSSWPVEGLGADVEAIEHDGIARVAAYAS